MGSVILSMGDIGRNEFQKRALDVLDNGRNEGRQLTFRMSFNEFSLGLSVTYVDDRHWREELIRSAVQMDQCNFKQWFAVQLRNESPYKINRIEKGKFHSYKNRREFLNFLENEI